MTDRPLRILHVVPSYLPAWRYGGPIRSVHGLARAQAEAGDEVWVATTDANGPGRLDVPTDRPVDVEGVHVLYFRRERPARLYRSTAFDRGIDALVRGVDVVHLHSVFLLPTLRAARAATRAGVPYFVSPRGMLVDELIRSRGSLRKRLWIRAFERRTLGEASGLVLQSERELREIERLGLALAPPTVVPNGLDFREIDRSLAAVPSDAVRRAMRRRPYALYLGRLSWKKDVASLIDAAATLPNLHVIVAGPDDEGLGVELDRRADERGLGERWIRLGEVLGADKWHLLAGAELLCLPSLSENFGIVALESLAVGRPVVLREGVGIAEFAALDGGLHVAGAGVEALRVRLGEVFDGTNRALERARAARSAVRESFGWGRIAERMREVYRTP